MNFNADGVLVFKGEDGEWCTDKNITINTVGDIHNAVVSKENIENYKAEQININKYEKVFYSFENSIKGVDAKVTTDDGTVEMAFSPLLLVNCDDTKPIKMNEKVLSEIMSKIELF